MSQSIVTSSRVEVHNNINQDLENVKIKWMIAHGDGMRSDGTTQVIAQCIKHWLQWGEEQCAR